MILFNSMVEGYSEGRLRSLDVFRGMAMVIMVFANAYGEYCPYEPFRHMPWHGCSLADVVFPCFLFMMGVSLVFSLRKMKDRGEASAALRKVFRRALIMIGVGLALNSFPWTFERLASFRIFGVLQRIGICYLFAAMLYLRTSLRTQIAFAASVIIGYGYLLQWIPVPGFGVNDLSPMGNWASYIDRQVMGGRLFRPEYDPEGLLSTLAAVVTVLTGVWTGTQLRSGERKKGLAWAMGLSGAAIAALGYLWSFQLPLNKALWTSSFVLWTSGLGLVGLAFCYWIIDLADWTILGLPFEPFGANAGFLFVLSLVFLMVQSKTMAILPDGSHLTLRSVLVDFFFGWTSPASGSLLYSILFTLLCWLIGRVLQKKGLLLRV